LKYFKNINIIITTTTTTIIIIIIIILKPQVQSRRQENRS